MEVPDAQRVRQGRRSAFGVPARHSGGLPRQLPDGCARRSRASWSARPSVWTAGRPATRWPEREKIAAIGCCWPRACRGDLLTLSTRRSPRPNGRGELGSFRPSGGTVVRRWMWGTSTSVKAFTTLDGSTIREIAGRATLLSRNQEISPRRPCHRAARRSLAHHRSLRALLLHRRRGRLRVAGEWRDVGQSDCAVLPAQCRAQAREPSTEPLVLLCCCAPPYSHEDTVLTEEPRPAP